MHEEKSQTDFQLLKVIRSRGCCKSPETDASDSLKVICVVRGPWVREEEDAF